jgi:hypothetical protein
MQLMMSLGWRIFKTIATFFFVGSLLWSPVLAEEVSPPPELKTPQEALETIPIVETPTPKPTSDRPTVKPLPQKDSNSIGDRQTYPEPPHPYNYKAIQKFDQQLYGEGG